MVVVSKGGGNAPCVGVELDISQPMGKNSVDKSAGAVSNVSDICAKSAIYYTPNTPVSPKFFMNNCALI
jgi:hypothetical protein